MSKHSLSLKSWAALAPGMESQGDWQQWALGEKTIALDLAQKPKIKQVPPMLRRRLSPLGKIALSCAYQLSADFDAKQAVVFCSQHGEVGRTVEMLKVLAQAEPLSPTAFSLSVHNAIAGIYSIANHDTNPITAIAAGPDSLCAALLEAYTLLNDDGIEQVLCVVYDEPLPEIYPQQSQLANCAMAMAFIVQGPEGPGLQIDFELFENPNKAKLDEPGLEFLRFLLAANNTPLEIAADHRLWRWTRPEA